MTARGLLDAGQVPKGEYLIQTAAGSTLGRMITVLAKHMGISIIDVVRRSAQKEELLKAGCEHAIASGMLFVAGLINETACNAANLCHLLTH